MTFLLKKRTINASLNNLLIMPEENHLIQETLVSKEENQSPEYQRLIVAYCDNPFFDLTRAAIAEYIAGKEPPQPPAEETPL